MEYHISHEGKFVCVYGDDVPEDMINDLRAKGYRIAYFLRGTQPVASTLRTIVLSRCT